MRDDSSVLLAARESYEALAEHVQRARAEGLLGSRPVPEVAFQFHATCTGLATNELLTRDPPIGVRMWAAVLPEPDWIALWRGALGALLAGLAVEESSTPA